LLEFKEVAEAGVEARLEVPRAMQAAAKAHGFATIGHTEACFQSPMPGSLQVFREVSARPLGDAFLCFEGIPTVGPVAQSLITILEDGTALNTYSHADFWFNLELRAAMAAAKPEGYDNHWAGLDIPLSQLLDLHTKRVRHMAEQRGTRALTHSRLEQELELANALALLSAERSVFYYKVCIAFAVSFYLAIGTTCAFLIAAHGLVWVSVALVLVALYLHSSVLLFGSRWVGPLLFLAFGRRQRLRLQPATSRGPYR
jgi:hypothetical protein